MYTHKFKDNVFFTTGQNQLNIQKKFSEQKKIANFYLMKILNMK